MRKLVRVYYDFIVSAVEVPAFEDLKIPRSVDRSGKGVKKRAYDEAVLLCTRRAVRTSQSRPPAEPLGLAKELVCLSALRLERERLRARIGMMLEDLRGRRFRRGDSVNWPSYVSASHAAEVLVHELTELEETVLRLRAGSPCARRDARGLIASQADGGDDAQGSESFSENDEDFDCALFGDGES